MHYLYNPHGTVFRFLSDEAGRAPDAESYICAGIGFCFMPQFGRYAKIAKTPLEDYRIIQDAHFSLAGASDGTGQAGRADPLETHCYLRSGQEDSFAQRALDMAGGIACHQRSANLACPKRAVLFIDRADARALIIVQYGLVDGAGHMIFTEFQR